MDEFDFIETYLKPLAGPEALGFLDDAALYKPAAGYDLVLSSDMLVESVHFPKGQYGENTAQKALRVNLSDLAAKGAEPKGYLLSIAWPKNLTNETLKLAGSDFAEGLRKVQEEFSLTLFGGDTVRTDGPMVVNLTVIGIVPAGEMVTRSGAKPGDEIWVTGTIGDAYLGLQSVLQSDGFEASTDEWVQAYHRPTPRLKFAKPLRRFATSSIDISDGLLSDAGHIARASSCGLQIDIYKVPLSTASSGWVGCDLERLKTLVTAGDDYELLFTACPKDSSRLVDYAEKAGLQLTKIGICERGKGVTPLGSNGQRIEFSETGYNHFLK